MTMLQLSPPPPLHPYSSTNQEAKRLVNNAAAQNPKEEITFVVNLSSRCLPCVH